MISLAVPAPSRRLSGRGSAIETRARSCKMRRESGAGSHAGVGEGGCCAVVPSKLKLTTSRRHLRYQRGAAAFSLGAIVPSI